MTFSRHIVLGAKNKFNSRKMTFGEIFNELNFYDKKNYSEIGKYGTYQKSLWPFSASNDLKYP